MIFQTSQKQSIATFETKQNLDLFVFVFVVNYNFFSKKIPANEQKNYFENKKKNKYRLNFEIKMKPVFQEMCFIQNHILPRFFVIFKTATKRMLNNTISISTNTFDPSITMNSHQTKNHNTTTTTTKKKET